MILVPIIEKYSSFTKGEQQIADYILNNPEEALSKTASELASASHTSSAAIVRFSRKIGYDGYSDMKVGLAKYFSDRQHFEKDMIIQANDSYENCANKLITQIVEVCSSTADHIDYRVLSRVIAAINQASCVYLLGIGSSANVALDLQQKLLRNVNEALHLSDQEKGIVMDCLKKISIELEHAIDKHSKALIAMNIELLLNYCMRFYERQFITRSDANKDALTKFEQLLNEYFLSKLPMQEGLPSVKYFADKICLSSNYFGDMVKKETGKTPQEHIQDKVIEMAKEHITETDETVSQIAYTLGFQYPQHLCRLFKKRVGCTPNEYRTQQGQII